MPLYEKERLFWSQSLIKNYWYCFYFAESLKIYLNRKHLVLTSASSSSLSWCVSSGAHLSWESGPTLMCSWQKKKYLNNLLRYLWLLLGLHWSFTDGSFFTCSGNVEHETCEGMVTTCGAWNPVKECRQLSPSVKLHFYASSPMRTSVISGKSQLETFP